MTLIELIVVLALLSIVAAIAAPSLSPFFRGRRILEESRRVLALTRYARNEAISTGTPMDVRFSVVLGQYGMFDALATDVEEDERAVQFTLAEDLRFEIADDMLDNNGIATIRFLPDGSVADGSLENLRIWQDVSDKVLEIGREGNTPIYSLRDESTDELQVTNDGR
jgi:type II secretion system protein H